MKQSVKIKICGLKRKEDIEIVNRLQPDYVGLVFAGSKRRVSEETAAELARLLDSGIQKVGVFVDAPEEQILRLLENRVIDLAQLHGNESEEAVHRIRMQSQKPVIRVRILQDSAEAESAMKPEYMTEAEYMLFDSGMGSGRCLDEKNLALLKQFDRPYFLAGGLDPENVTGILDKLSGCIPYAVDVSSGVETDGYKDEQKIRDFIARVRSWDEEEKGRIKE